MASPGSISAPSADSSPTQEPRLRPREIPREKRRVDARKLAQRAIDVREIRLI
jgi:hypothetical protein